MNSPVSVAIIGASGYSGGELLRLLAVRTDVSVVYATAQEFAGRAVGEVHPDLAGVLDLRFESYTPEGRAPVDVAFLALPPGQAMQLVPQVRRWADRIIDLSGDFRLRSADVYAQYYGHTHAAPELLADAVYGLPEISRDAIRTSRFIANPGCYPTAAVLALAPALQEGLVDPGSLVVNALSGVSGAGRSKAVELSFSEVNENVRAYKVGMHQHTPEIESVLERVTGRSVRVSFVPHLLPITRGIHATVLGELTADVPEGDIRDLYRRFYRTSPFVRIREGLPQLQSVTRTNFCDIGLVVDRRTHRLILLSVIDNLLKGAAGQAVQNMNLLCGFPETRGLPGGRPEPVPLFPTSQEILA